MKITDVISENGILLHQDAEQRQDVLDILVSLHKKSGNIDDEKAFKAAILAREEQGNTAVGGGIAVPHAKSSTVKKAALTAVTLEKGADWSAPDGEKVRLIFMIAAPAQGDEHLSVLSRLVKMLSNKRLTDALTGADTPEEFMMLLKNCEEERIASEKKPQPQGSKKARILAVTACPTGIAHTFMAAEALTKKAEEMGISLKAETNGSGGAKNVLTSDEIKAADVIIIAADRTVEMARFDGKRVIKTGVSDGVHHPEKLLKDALSGKGEIYRSGEKNSVPGDGPEKRVLYKHLMNGVSHMLPFVVGGGLFIAIGFLWDTLSGAAQTDSFGSSTPVSAFLNAVGSGVFSFMLPVLAGYIAMSIADRPGLLAGFAGGWLAYIGSTYANPTGQGEVSSGFLGALFAGFAAGYLMLLLRRATDFFPRALEGIKPVLIYPLVGLILIALVVCGVNPLMGIINTALYNFLDNMGSVSAILLGAVLGGMMSVDMGGPFNKAAYVFGTASLASGNQSIMAAVMAGGMVPPLAIALATTFFPKRFNSQERKNGPVNYVMGLSFITEGAIPYAASDPLRVIPSCIIGAAAAGALSTALRCTLAAPHGGIFVFPVVGNWAYYLLSVVAGSVIGALLLALLKKNVEENKNDN